MSDLLQSIPAPFNMIVLIVLICTTGGVVTTLVQQVRAYLCHREDLELKREMLDRGMSGDEIERVMRAKSPFGAGKS